MLKIRCLIMILVMMVYGVGAFAQIGLAKGRRPKFSSVYTSTGRSCKTIPGEAEGILCKGHGGYSIIVGYGAVAENILAKSAGGETTIPLSPAKEGYLTQGTGPVEWRLANGRPFAVIIRFGYYDHYKVVEAAGNGEIPYQAKYKTGESLIVKGLKGYEWIDFELDAKTPNANVKAREFADNAFLKGR